MASLVSRRMNVEAAAQPSLPSCSVSVADDAASIDAMRVTYEAQLRSYLHDGPPDLRTRKDRLDRLAVTLTENADEFIATVGADFGHRPATSVLATEILLMLEEIRSTKQHLRGWMQSRRPQPRYIRALGIDAWVEPTPLGVVGVISPWNFPVALAVRPAIAAIAAGNRVMLKPSELTARTAVALAEAISRRFAAEEVAVITGGPEVGAAFSALPFDHLFLTGSPAVARRVQRAAADNLTPVTLELGGKNPAIVGPDASLGHAVSRIIKARLANSGQICLSPDYVFVPRDRVDQFVGAALNAARALLPRLGTSSDVCTILNDAHYRRLAGLIDDACRRGAAVHYALHDGEAMPPPSSRRMPLTLIALATPEMAVMQDEIFGPVLPILPYDRVQDVIDFVNDRPAPLGAYWFGPDSPHFRDFVRCTRSGGVTRNDFAFHAVVPGLPFGGVGNSGTGYYHGQYGFDTFSHLRAVAVSPKLFSPVSMLSPPFPGWLERGLRYASRLWGRLIARRLASRRS
jgi:coniferyl-aldehyde dehydrogenase